MQIDVEFAIISAILYDRQKRFLAASAGNPSLPLTVEGAAVQAKAMGRISRLSEDQKRHLAASEGKRALSLAVEGVDLAEAAVQEGWWGDFIVPLR